MPQFEPGIGYANLRPRRSSSLYLWRSAGFLDFEDLMNSQGEVALILDFDPATGQVFVTGHRELQDLENTNLCSHNTSYTGKAPGPLYKK